MMGRDPGPPPEWPLRFVERIADTIRELTGEINHTTETSKENTSHLVDALKEHAAALVKSAESSDRFAKHLVYATWALVAVTVGLVIVGILQILILLAQK